MSDLTNEAFIACLRQFIVNHPLHEWSDHGTNFIGADRELKEIVEILIDQKNTKRVSEFCLSQKISWSFIPDHAPHFVAYGKHP